MYTKSTEIALKNVVFLPEIYPRSKAEESRIKLFQELMESGTNFPPIKVATILDGEHKGKYALLDGYHRLRAYEQLGKEKVRAFFLDVPRERWLLKAASFNTQGSAQLKRGDLKQVIIKAYESGINIQIIAREVGCSEQYVRRVLKPIRDKERNQRDAAIRHLAKEGYTQEEIARKAGVTRGRVAQIVNNETSFIINNSKKANHLKSLEAPLGINNFPEMLTPSGSPEVIYKGPPSNAGPPGKKEGLSEETEDRTPPRVTETSSLTDTGPSTKKKDCPSFGCNCAADKTEPRQDAEKSPAPPVDEPQPHDKGHEPSPIREPQKVDPVKCSSVPIITHFLNYVHEGAIPGVERVVTEDGQTALRAVELVRKVNWDIVKISQYTGKPISFLRKVFSAAFAFALSNGSMQDQLVWRYASILQSDVATVRSLRYGLMFKAELSPVGRKGMDKWVYDNLDQSDMEAIARMVSTESLKVGPHEIPAAVAGGALPSRCVRFYEELPADIEEFLTNSVNHFRIIRDVLRKGKIKGEPLKRFIKLFNRLYGVVMEINECATNAMRLETRDASATGNVATGMELQAAGLPSSIDNTDSSRIMTIVERSLPPNAPMWLKQQIVEHGLVPVYKAISSWRYDGGMDIQTWIFMRATRALGDGQREATKGRLQSLDNLPIEPSADIG